MKKRTKTGHSVVNNFIQSSDLIIGNGVNSKIRLFDILYPVILFTILVLYFKLLGYVNFNWFLLVFLLVMFLYLLYEISKGFLYEFIHPNSLHVLNNGVLGMMSWFYRIILLLIFISTIILDFTNRLSNTIFDSHIRVVNLYEYLIKSTDLLLFGSIGSINYNFLESIIVFFIAITGWFFTIVFTGIMLSLLSIGVEKKQSLFGPMLSHLKQDDLDKELNMKFNKK